MYSSTERVSNITAVGSDCRALYASVAETSVSAYAGGNAKRKSPARARKTVNSFLLLIEDYLLILMM